MNLTESGLRHELDRLRAENSQLLQAVGIATTAVGSMEIDVSDPIGMMQTVVTETARLRARIAELEAQMVAVLGALEELTNWPQDSRLTYYVKTTLEAPPMAVQPAMVGGVFESMEERAKAMLPWAVEQLAEARKAPGIRTALAAAQQDSERLDWLEAQGDNAVTTRAAIDAARGGDG